MRAPAFLSCTVLFVACSSSEQKPAADSPATAAAVAPAPAPAATPISLASLAGKWTQRTRREGSDSVIVTSELVATADASGWTLKLPGRPVMPVKVTADGDSLMVTSGPYESVLRKGVQVTTNSVWRMQGDKLVGSTIAHYKTAGADSVARLTSELTRNP